MEAVLPLLVILFFVVIGGIIIAAIIGAILKYFRNLNSPVVSTPAHVVAKRTEINRSGTSDNRSIYTSYYVTFEDESGARRELEVKSSQYGLLVEGDGGTLTTQGDWYKGFSRRTAGRPRSGLLRR